jgi:hypothetical protein
VRDGVESNGACDYTASGPETSEERRQRQNDHNDKADSTLEIVSQNRPTTAL